MNDDNATSSEIRSLKQTILDLHRQTHRKLDTLIDDVSQLKRDVNTLAKNTEHTRDETTGQLRKAG